MGRFKDSQGDLLIEVEIEPGTADMAKNAKTAVKATC